ncbi:hypothetical protein Hanom_Chr12g01095641 [Helianthus anomalus]
MVYIMARFRYCFISSVSHGHTWGLEETTGFLMMFPVAGLLSSFLCSNGFF